MRILSETDIQTEKICRAGILRLLQDHQWHQTMDIIHAAGGSEGMRRLRELRRAPFNYPIESSTVPGSRQWQYRLMKDNE